MKITREDIEKYGTEDEKKILEIKKYRPYGYYENQFGKGKYYITPKGRKVEGTWEYVEAYREGYEAALKDLAK